MTTTATITAARLEDLLAQVAETLESVDSPARAVRWLGRIQNANDNDLASMSIGNFPAVVAESP
jgi:hypothetical protein